MNPDLETPDPEEPARRLPAPFHPDMHDEQPSPRGARTESIIFRVWENGGNYREVSVFCGEQPACPVCGGSGEYEGEYGPKGCQPCNSRCFAFIDYARRRVYADDGDKIEKRSDGLHLIEAAIHP